MEWISDTERNQRMGQEPYPLALNEIAQAASSGRDVRGLPERLVATTVDDSDELLRLYHEALTAPLLPGVGSFELSGWNEVLAALPRPRPGRSVNAAELPDRLLGAWTGRVVGNMLGKPVEKGWDRHRLRSYLESEDSYPLRDYVPLADERTASAFGFESFRGLTRGRVDGGVRDDDVDYTVLGLMLFEEYGSRFTTANVAYEWLRRFPVYQLYTAERAAYTNLIREVPLANVGSYHNPYREWIGALIRADIYGYVCPGQPRLAATFAYRDAYLSHRANGLYGSMFAAGLVAAAFTTTSAEESVQIASEQVPPDSRLGREIRLVVSQYRSGLSWDECMNDLDNRHAGLSWVHVLNNTGALVAALLWGENDFASTVGLAVQSGLDTDSIAATAGSWAGGNVGYGGLPEHLVEPLHDRTETAVFGATRVRLTDLVRRTLAAVEAVASTSTSTSAESEES